MENDELTCKAYSAFCGEVIDNVKQLVKSTLSGVELSEIIGLALKFNKSPNANPLVEIRRSEIHGKGVFALEDLEPGTILTCDILPISKSVDNDKVLVEYQYPLGIEDFCICAGFGSYFNHAEKPNIRISAVDHVNLTKSFVTMKFIKAGTELTLFYNDNFSKMLDMTVI